MIRALACLVVGFVAGYLAGAHAVLVTEAEQQSDYYAGWSEAGDNY